ncbi:MAG: DMT family transporter [Chitinophagaceae bacterium]|nr:DMT family transporter [Chitinophagaceae bacterium]
MAVEKTYLRAVIYIKLILVAIMWGGTFIATRMASQVFEPFTGASFRYLFALVFMIPLMLMKDKTALRINKKQFLQLLVLGSTGIFAYSFFFFNGMKRVEASHGSLIVALNPVLVMLISSLFGKDRINGISWLFILILQRMHSRQLLHCRLPPGPFSWAS